MNTVGAPMCPEGFLLASEEVLSSLRTLQSGLDLKGDTIEDVIC